MESKKAGEVQADAASEETKQETVTQPDDVMAKLKALEATNARLLKESQEHKLKAKSLLSEKEEKEKTELEGKEKYKEAYILAQKKLQEKDSQLAQLKRVNINKTIDAELAKLASDAHSVDAVKKLINTDILDIVEENDDIKISGLKEALDVARKDMPYLFKAASQAKTMSAKPGVTKPEPLDLSKMDAKSLANLLAQTHAKN